ncbi:ATP-dependent helicase HrpB [Actinomyces capricornis]|uniref:ATP-dependent helicase HrpB n=1 Tax=Actinomyces capricornis TaxID=2755559 RepID=A0ABM7UIR4_9ACTO|nr:ATP-dependent helicase HrpB [Actinomyces capricornis]BDA64409.1 ATP-dependent helicase HrpB [Actinomyces capricornis]
MCPDREPDPLSALFASPPDLPVLAALPELRAALAQSTRPVILTAPPGTGKTTLVPVAVHDHLRAQRSHQAGGSQAGRSETGHSKAGRPLAGQDHGAPTPGRVVVTQPRRVAARAAARRLASLLGQEVGGTVGYAVRGERRASPATRIEVVTSGLLLRRLQSDPELPGVSAVVLDEVHERSLDSDLLLALLLDARALREDLPLIAMSATVQAERLAGLLGARAIEAPGRLHPVEEIWAPSRTGRLGAHGVPREFLAHVADTALGALESHEGDALVFLPGAREVDEVTRRLRTGVPDGVDVLPLHGRLPAAAQDAALAASAPGRRRIVVATSVAESSLTVPGVRIVVDAMLAREPRLDVARSMSGLVTVGASRASGIQRAGRAGREGPGVAYRCCSPTDWARAPLAPTPEILTADLTRTALELAAWGAPDGDLAWLDEPPAAAMAAARETLGSLGLVDDGALTPLGRAVADIPTDVRPARALLAAVPVLGRHRAAEATALLTTDLRTADADLPALARRLREGGPGSGPWRTEARRLERAAGTRAAKVGPEAGRGLPSRPPAGSPHPPDAQEAIALVVGLAHPQWIAQRRGQAPAPGSPARYLTVAGSGLRLPEGSPLAGEEWLAVAEIDRSPTGGPEGLIRAAAPLDEAMALELAAPWLAQDHRVAWQGQVLRSEQVRVLGAIPLSRAAGSSLEPQEAARAVVERVRDKGLGMLTWSGQASRLRARLGLLHTHLGDPWPAMDEESLLERAQEWLAPAVMTAVGDSSSSLDLGALDMEGALRSLLPWPQAARLEELVPERLEVPSGSLVRVEYGQRPRLEVAVQECFGWQATPRIVQGRVAVQLHLLSPARRPVAVTDDLASFWRQGYPQVRAEMRGRYPKHAWPEDPWQVPPHRGTARRR